MNKPKRVGIYLRVSTNDQTVENQRLDILRAAEQRGWTVVGEYADCGISGMKGRDKRPELDRLLKDASAGKLDMVAAWSIDRLGRSLQHLVGLLEDLHAANVGLFLLQQQIDTSTAAGRAFLQMAGVFAEFERSVIVDRVNAGLRRAREQGKRLGRPTVACSIERQIRELRAQGLGKGKIAKALHCGVDTINRVMAERDAA